MHCKKLIATNAHGYKYYVDAHAHTNTYSEAYKHIRKVH